jgi:hypothetical protein
MGATALAQQPTDGLKAYYTSQIDALEVACRDKATTLRRLEAQRNELNSKGACVRVFILSRARGC